MWIGGWGAPVASQFSVMDKGLFLVIPSWIRPDHSLSPP